jgi:hypothetical protein
MQQQNDGKIKKVVFCLTASDIAGMKTSYRETRNKGRAPGQTILGVSMSKSLKEKIKAAAAAENRTMANWCVHHLEKILDAMDEKARTPLPISEPMILNDAPIKANGTEGK